MPISAIHPKKTLERRHVLSSGAIVEYEQHGRGIVALVLAEQKDKWKIINADGTELNLPAARLYLLPGSVPESVADTTAAKLEYLKQVLHDVETIYTTIELEEVWNTIQGEIPEISIDELTEIALVDNSLVNHLAVRHALFNDKIFFKRKKNGYEPRSPEVVEELKTQAAAEAKKFQRQHLLKETLAKLYKTPSAILPEEIYEIEKIAALGSSAPVAKDLFTILDETLQLCGLPVDGKPEKKAFRYLQAIGHFTPHQNLAAIRLGRSERFSPKILQDAALIGDLSKDPLASKRIDIRNLLIITIDDDSTQDIDDGLSVERTPDGGYRLGIHITDVASHIAPESELEKEAVDRGTSVYFPDGRIAMLPKQLSEGALSLFHGVDRLAISFFLELDAHYNILTREVQPTLINVRQRMSYDTADAQLYQDGLDTSTISPEVAQLLEQLWAITCELESRRANAGAIQFLRKEMNPKLDEKLHVSLEVADFDTPAHKLVGEMMIVANETAALYASSFNAPLAYRGQEAPDVDIQQQCLDIPEGPARDYCQRSFLKRSTVTTQSTKHFGLGLQAYAQLTSPLRRATDLINQRQINALLLDGVSHYTEEQFSLLLAEIEARVSEASQLQRERTRYWLLHYLKQENIKELEGLVTRIDGLKPLAEVSVIFSVLPFTPLKPKKNYSDPSSVKLGDVVKLRIERLDPRDDLIRLVQLPG